MGTPLARNLSAFLLFASGLFAQSFSYGVKGGYPLTYSENSITSLGVQLNSSSREFIVGGTAELGLPAGFSVEGDFLFHPYNIRSIGLISSITTYNLFEVPVLGKLRIGHGLAAPYVDAGPQFRFKPSSLALSHNGFAVGAGLEFKLIVAKVSPEIRYTRWIGSTQPGANPDQIAFLVGVTF